MGPLFAWLDVSGAPEAQLMPGVDAHFAGGVALLLRAALTHMELSEHVPTERTFAEEDGTPAMGSVWAVHIASLNSVGLTEPAAVSRALARVTRRVAVHRLHGGEQGSDMEAGHNLKLWLQRLGEGQGWSNTDGGLLLPLMESAASCN
jgi:hypothetical protein